MTFEIAQHPDWFSKPGDSIRAMMQRRDVSADELACHLDGGVHDVRGLLNAGIRIDKRSSDVLSRVLGGTQGFWMKRQEKFDEALNRALRSASKCADEWLDCVPMPEKSRKKPESTGERMREVRRRMIHYNVATLESWEQRYGRICTETHFRRSESFVPQNSAVLLWLRKGEIEADFVQTHDWRPDELRTKIKNIRKITNIKRPAVFLPKLRSICAAAGVAVVVVKTPKGCFASGATRLLSSNKAMMLLSIRHLSNDQFWFTVFHEIGHLLLHDEETYVDDDSTPNDNAEKEANDFARRCIIPQDREDEFFTLKKRKDEILKFSRSLGIAPGLVVGQMQHSEMIEHKSMNHLKRRWKRENIEHATIYD